MKIIAWGFGKILVFVVSVGKKIETVQDNVEKIKGRYYAAVKKLRDFLEKNNTATRKKMIYYE